MLTVHVRFNDGVTGRPTPVRFQVSRNDTPFAPLGRLATFPTAPGRAVGVQVQVGNSGNWWYADGACEIQLPPGPLRVRAFKGPSYRPLDREVNLSPGQLSLRFTLERWAEPEAEGWYAGDTHCLFLSPHAALLEAEAEGLAVVNLLACQWQDPLTGDTLLPNIEAFSGSVPALERNGHLVVVNTLNSHPVLGTLGLLNCHRAVFPLRLGDGHQGFDWTLDDWCGQCHRKTGLVVWADPRSLHPGIPPAARLQSEALANLVRGQIDAYEVTSLGSEECQELADWYTLVDAGLRVPLVGGSGRNSNATTLGRVRTYALLAHDEALSYQAWIEALRRGRTFVTNGPLLTLLANGQGPGGQVEMAADEPLRIEARVFSGNDSGALELMWNGEVVASRETAGEPLTASLQLEQRVTESGWLAVRFRGEHLQADGQKPCAHTSAVYVLRDGHPWRPRAQAVDRLLGALATMEEWAIKPGNCTSERQQQQLLHTLGEARQRLNER